MMVSLANGKNILFQDPDQGKSAAIIKQPWQCGKKTVLVSTTRRRDGSILHWLQKAMAEKFKSI